MEIDFDPIHRRALEKLARERGKTPAQVLRELVTKALRDKRKNGASPNHAKTRSFLDAAKRIGAVGCVKGGAADMSTNPKHMEGFGDS